MIIRRWIGVLLALLLMAEGAGAQSRRPLELRVGDAGEPSRLAVSAPRLLRDGGLREALSSGLPLRFHLRVELWRDAFFDRLVDAEERSLVLVEDPLDRSFLLQGARVERRYLRVEEVETAIERALSPELHPRKRGRYYYLATLEIETLSLSDLEELRRWLRGEVQPAVEGRSTLGRAIGQGVQRTMVRIMGLPSRRYEARSGYLVLR